MDDVERRIRAAMTLAGIDSFKQLAERIDARNLGERTLRDLDASATRPQKRAVAEACGLPYEFFTVDFQRLPEIGGGVTPEPGPADELRELRQTMRQLRDDLDAQAAVVATANTVYDRLDALETEVRELRSSAKGSTAARPARRRA